MARLIDRLLLPQSHTSNLTDEERVGLVQMFQSWQDGVESPETSFESFVREAYKANGVVFATILARMMLMSDVRFKYRSLQDKELFGNPNLRILERPWQGGTTNELVARMEQDASLAGNAYVHRVTPGNSLQRLRPDWVKIVSNGQELLGYVYEPPGVKPVFIPADEVAHWTPVPDPAAAFRGMSWITPVAQEIVADSDMTLHKRKFLRNAATPNMLVKVEGKLAPDVKKDIRAEIARRYEGVENAYKTMLLEGGADAKIIGANMKELEFAITQAHGENRILIASGVPAIVVGIQAGLNASTYTNYGQAMRRFGDLTGRPLWRSMAAALETVVEVPAGAELWYDTTDIVALRQDEKEQAEIESSKAGTIKSFIDAGFTPESAIAAVRTSDLRKLEHTGLYSVQLQPAGKVEQGLAVTDDETPAPNEGEAEETEDESSD